MIGGQFRAITSRQRGRVKGRPGSGGGGGSSGLRVSLNMGGIGSGGATNWFIDQVKGTESSWSGLPRTNGALDANHYPANLAIGQQVDLLVWENLGDLRQVQTVKPGNYKITWDATGGGGCTVTAVGTGLINIVSGTAGIATFTANSNASYLYIRVTNGTGSAGRGATNIKCFHVDHEAALGAGEIFHPDFITQLALFPNMRFMRFLDWQIGNVGSQIDTDTLCPMSYQAWGRREWGIPGEVMGLMAKKLRELFGRDVDIWSVMPRQATNAYMLEFFTRMKNADPTGNWTLRCEGANEVWNSGFPVYGYFANTYWSENSLTVYDDNGTPGSTAQPDRASASAVHHAMRTWTAADTVFGTSRVVPIIGVQTGWLDYMNSWIHQRDTTNTLYGGATGMSVINSRGGKIAFTMYFQTDAMGTNQAQHLANDIGSYSDAAVQALWYAHIDDVKNNQLIYSLDWYRTRGLTCGVTIYEANCHDFYDKHNTLAGAPQTFVSVNNTTNNTLQFAGGTAWVVNGDVIRSPNQTSVSGTVYPHDIWVRKTGTNELRCYLSQAAYAADTGNTGAGAGTVVAGTFQFVPETRFRRWADKLSAMQKAPLFADMYAYAVAALQHPTINADTFALFAYSASANKGAADSYRFSSSFDGQNDGLYTSLTPAVAYLAGLTGT
jgi:hypothetical protein